MGVFYKDDGYQKGAEAGGKDREAGKDKNIARDMNKVRGVVDSRYTSEYAKGYNGAYEDKAKR